MHSTFAILGYTLSDYEHHLGIALIILGYALSAYFFTAVWVPRIRIRYGAGRATVWSLSGKNRERYHLRRPVMSTISCLGLGILIGSIAMFFSVVQYSTTMARITIVPLLIGLVLTVIGQTIANDKSKWKWERY